MLPQLAKGCNLLAKAISCSNDDDKFYNPFDSAHKIVSIFLGISFIIITASRYAVDPIKCNSGIVLPNVAWPVSMIENYCYMGKTYVVLEAQNRNQNQNKKNKTGRNVRNGAYLTYEGFWTSKKWKSQKTKKIYQSHYYWMQYIILLQAFSFILPKMFWQIMEGDKLQTFTSLLTSYKKTKDKKEESEEDEKDGGQVEIDLKILALESFWNENFGKQNSYFFLYLVCELLYLINVGVQYYFVDFLLNHMMYTDSWAIINGAFEIGDADLRNYFGITFPIMAMCEIPMHDLNSVPVTSTLNCVLTLNYLYRKIVFISWVLFSILGILTCVNILIHFLIALCPKAIRNKVLHFRYNIKNGDDIEHFFKQDFQIGDLFFLFYLKGNMEPVMKIQFREFIFKTVIEKGS